jgi:uroporphyrinogen-III decarboxylase
MAKTAIADIIIPTQFEQYAIERTAELSAFGQCGIIEHSPVFDDLVCTPEQIGQGFEAKSDRGPRMNSDSVPEQIGQFFGPS